MGCLKCGGKLRPVKATKVINNTHIIGHVMPDVCKKCGGASCSISEVNRFHTLAEHTYLQYQKTHTEMPKYLYAGWLDVSKEAPKCQLVDCLGTLPYQDKFSSLKVY
jgi:hypothetical protein